MQNWSALKKVFTSFLAVRVAVGFVTCFTYFKGPHIIRQIDTLSVSFRYWMRFNSNESWETVFLPAVLSAGDSIGITPMEFPLINILASPSFYFGIESGRIVARLLLLSLLILLSVYHWKLWRGVKVYGIDMGFVALIIPIFAIAQKYFDKFMPDYAAFLLVSISTIRYWKGGSKTGSFLFAAIGLLIKPTAVIAFAPLLFHPSYKSITKSIFTWIAPATILSVLYYTLGVEQIKQVSDFPHYFSTSLSNPLKNLTAFLTQPWGIFDFINKDLFTFYSFIPILGWDIYKKLKKEQGVPNFLWLLLFLQVITVAALRGDSTFIHSYYAMPATFISCYILVYFLKSSGKYLATLVILMVIGHQVEGVIHRLKPFKENHFFHQCSKIKKHVDFKGEQKIRSSFSPYPTIGLCLGKVQNSSQARIGVYYKNKVPNDLQNAKNIYETEDLSVFKFKD